MLIGERSLAPFPGHDPFSDDLSHPVSLLPGGSSPPQWFSYLMTFTSISPSVFPGRLVSQDVNRLFLKNNEEGCICESGVRLCDQIGSADTG